MKKIILITIFLNITLTIFAQNQEYENRVKSSIELLKNEQFENGLASLIGEGTILYNTIFGVETNKNNQITQIQNLQSVYGKILDCELVWSKSVGKVTNQWYLIYHENFPMVLDIIFYEIEGKITVIKYSFEETATEMPSLLDK
ncbi:MAG: hypothetical protein IPM32_02315 [Ignavibacteriae bacterium]|nr:hypothetical protein [Ignavibacteriota bacterium]